MSQEQFTKFVNEFVPKNPAVKAELAGVANEEAFATAALKHGAANGFSFTKEEMGAVMTNSVHRDTNGNPVPSKPGAVTVDVSWIGKNKLSLDQLESVAGGVNRTDATNMCCW